MNNVSSMGLILIVAIVCIVLAGVAGTVLLLESNNATGAATVLGFLAPTIASLFALIRVESTSNTVAAQHVETTQTLKSQDATLAAIKSQLTPTIVTPHDTTTI